MRSQGAVAVGNKIEGLLSRIVALENHFDSRPSDVADQRRRDELRRYVATFPFGFSAEFLPASLKASKGNCGLWLRCPRRPPKKFAGSLRTYERLCLITRFVHDPKKLADVNMGNRWHDKRKHRVNDVLR